MAPDSPSFSIVIPAYNRAHLIAKTLDSILQQTFTDFEVLVIDDGSTDNTEEVVSTFHDDRIQYFKKSNAERGAARNFGTRKASGKFVNFFDSDDLMYPNHLAEAKKLIENNDPVFFHLAYDHRYIEGTIFDRVNEFNDRVADVILFDNKLSPNGVFLRRDIAIQFPFEEDRVLASSEDWELWIRLVSRFKLYYSNEITSSMVNHEGRSLRTISAEKVVARDLLLIDKIKRDIIAMNNYGNAFPKFVADRYTFFMLVLNEQGRKSEVLRWGVRALRVYPSIFVNKRFLASVKNCILK